jgi:hypothetical protein
MKLTSLILPICMLVGELLVVPAVGGTKEARPPKPEELVGSWIGFWEDGEFTRLDLHADFTGYCAFVAPVESISHDSGVDLYRVNSWNLQRWKFLVSLVPIDSRNGSVYLKGQVGLYDLELEVGGTDGKWKQELVLQKESRIQTLNLETKSKIEQAKTR